MLSILNTGHHFCIIWLAWNIDDCPIGLEDFYSLVCNSRSPGLSERGLSLVESVSDRGTAEGEIEVLSDERAEGEIKVFSGE